MTVDLKELGEALRPFLEAAETTVRMWDGVKHVEISPPDDQVFPAGPLTWGDLRRLARAAEGLSDAPSPTQEHRGERVDQGSEGGEDDWSSSDRWPSAGARMKFLGKNGYDHELAEAMATFEVGQVVTVVDVSVESWSHSIRFEEVEGRWNGVMFKWLPPDSDTDRQRDEAVMADFAPAGDSGERNHE